MKKFQCFWVIFGCSCKMLFDRLIKMTLKDLGFNSAKNSAFFVFRLIVSNLQKRLLQIWVRSVQFGSFWLKYFQLFWHAMPPSAWHGFKDEIKYVEVKLPNFFTHLPLCYLFLLQSDYFIFGWEAVRTHLSLQTDLCALFACLFVRLSVCALFVYKFLQQLLLFISCDEF